MLAPMLAALRDLMKWLQARYPLLVEALWS